MTRVKLCGITSEEDAGLAAESGADAIGLVFYAGSPRAVDMATAEAIVRTAGPFVTCVALFVNPAIELVEEVLARVRPHLLQFHGDENGAFCRRFRHPYLKAIRVRQDTDIEAAVAGFHDASGFIFDAWSSRQYGGTGEHFDWGKVEGFAGAPLILAGGLTPDNVGIAVARLKPYGVDVSSGIESSPGRKEPELMRRFVGAAKATEGSATGAQSGVRI